MSVETIYLVTVNGKVVAAYRNQAAADAEASEQGGTVEPMYLFQGVV